ncbi:uncharacterized protein MEPE_04071 [Melanopsichium pennsylvanicum]|uniref:Copper transport protein 86 n=2 Tax=Melanopsichium pennsylvanicum TaxID=63383 RepID=A0AAJ4XP65_9BASI|nr:hypothetical protein BN887_02387 [Melanopsichium pennsylvanicum 4]SNX85362.1 uncharacterized protein MEPE_04071 [Melanopsichium pennsylvanicum]
MRMENGVGDGNWLSSLLHSYQSLAARPLQAADLIAGEIELYEDLKANLTTVSQQLARHGSQRKLFMTSGMFDIVLNSLDDLYSLFEKVQNARPTYVQEEQGEFQCNAASVEDRERLQDPYYRIAHIATLCMRIIRNAMADCADAQSHLSHRFDLVAPFLTNITRFHTLNDPDTLLLCRSGVQMLSNLITTNREVQRQIWPRIMITDKDEEKLVLKLLSSPDTATQSAAQVLLINILRTPNWERDARKRCHELCTTPAGLQLVGSLLTISESIMLRTALATQDEASQEYELKSEIEGSEESLGFIYTIFAILFEEGYSSLLVSTLAPMEELSSTSSSLDLPIVSSSQITLLKLLDSWLHHSQKQVAEFTSLGTANAGGPTMRTYSTSGTDDFATEGFGLAGLVDMFIQLSAFARRAMSFGMAKDGASADQQPQDRRLIGVHHGLILLLQSLLSISMTADGWSAEHSSLVQYEESFASLSRILLMDMRRSEAFIDELVALLDQTHRYAPALSPFRPSGAGASSVLSEADKHRAMPQGHALSSTGKAAHETYGKQPSYGFDHLKRDIVRVIGSLVYVPTDNNSTSSDQQGVENTPSQAHSKDQIRQVQDRVREKGGLFHVLNMTVLDERNPCKSQPMHFQVD